MDKSGTIQQMEHLLTLYVDQQSSSQLSNMFEMSILSKMQDENAAPIIITFINKQLAAPVSRYKGLTLLDKVVTQCPLSLLIDNAASWTNICVNYSIKDPVSIIRFNVLVKILQLCSGMPDFNKSVVTLLPKINDLCLSVNPNNRVLSEGSLECLKVCLQKHPTTCGPFRSKIESYLSRYLTSALLSSTVKKAGTVFHYLQQVGGSGAEGITYKTSWSNQLTKLCSTMHTLYNQFFARVTEFEHRDIEVAAFEFASLLDKPDASVPYLTAGALKNVVIFMNCMLIEHFPVEKSISVSRILDVIKRGLLVDTFMEFNNAIDETEFAALLYVHQIDMLYLLRSLIASCKLNLIPYSFTITKLLADCLQRTQKNYFKNSGEYQKAVLRVLKYWFSIAGSKLTNTVSSKLVMLILSHAVPTQSTVMLCLNESQMRNRGKGKKRAIQETSKMNENLVRETQKSLEIKEIVCAEALNTAKSLLQHVMLQLDQDTYKALFQTIIQHILNIQGGKIVHPYSNPKCQAHLYEMLACILMQPTFCVSPILQMAINVFTSGQSRAVNSGNDEVFLACSNGLDILEKLCQATCPTLSINQHIGSDLAGDKSRNRNLETEQEDVHVSDSGTSNTISERLGTENQNTDAADDTTQISPQNDPSLLTEKVHILNVQIIKQGGSSGQRTYVKRSGIVGGTSNSIEDADPEEEMDVPEQETQNLEKEHDFTTEMKDMAIDHPVSLPLDCEGNELMVCKKEVEEEEETPSTGFMITDVCTLKKTESMVLDDQEEDMLNSFNDVLNQ